MGKLANFEQQQAIDARNPLITISAGAGTGKTWTLASRYLDLLKEHDIGKILTLTFTEKAAQEMRERIEKMLMDEKSSALSHFDEAYISTIHSFASRTLREAGLSVDIDPSFSIISNPQIDEIRARFTRSLDERLGVEILSQIPPDDVAKLAERCEDVHSAMGRTSEIFLSLDTDEPLNAILQILRKLLTPAWLEAWEIWNNFFNGAENLIIEKKSNISGQKLYEFMNEWRGKNFGDDDNGRKFFVALFYQVLRNTNWGKDIGGVASELLGQTAGDWRDERKKIEFLSRNLDINEVKKNFEQEFKERSELMSLCAEGWQIFESARKRDALLSFSDLIRFAAEFPPSGKFEQIMIDEFQDTDPLQEKMTRKMAANANVFVVGDPKQSIYGFRNADIRIFAEYANEARKNGNLYINMNQSFRMRGKLYEIINSLFSSVWPKSLGSSLPDLKYEPLLGIENGERESETLPLLTYLREEKIEGEKIAETQKRVFANLANTLKNWQETGLTVWDGETKSLRPLRWGDCAIITSRRATWPLLEEAFSAAGIPLAKESGMSWFDYGEVSDIVNMLRALAYPDDSLANEGWQKSIFAPEDENEMAKLRVNAQLRGASGAIEHLLDNLLWLKNVRPIHRQRALSNVRHAAVLAREYENSIYKSLPGCAQWLANSLRSGDKFEEPQFTDEKNSVKIMTVHASKGLEFPLVILCEMEKGINKGKLHNLVASRHLGAFSSSHEFFKSIHNALEEEKITEENQRLFYVAATRAKDALIFCAVSDEEGSVNKGSWLDFVQNWKDGEKYLAPYEAKEIPSQLKLGLEEPTPKQKISPLALPETQNLPTRLSATSFALYEWCPLAWRKRYRQGINLDWENYSDDALGSDVGSIAHWILARWDFDAENIDTYLPRQQNENSPFYLPPKLRGAFRDLYAQPQKLDIVRGWFSDLALSKTGIFLNKLFVEEKLKRETHFKVSLGGLRLFGSIDLFWEDESGLHLRDWKTSSLMHETYQYQLLFYAAALQKIFKEKKIASVSLISVRNGEEHPVEIGLLSNMEEKIRAAAKNSAKTWNPRKDNCNSCHFGCSSL